MFSGEPRSGPLTSCDSGHEGVDALDVDEEAALVAAGDVSLEGLVLVEVVLEDAPAPLAAGAVEREDDLAFLRFRLDDEDEDLVAGVEAGGAFGLKAVHLLWRDDAFGLGADVYEDAVSIGTDDDAFDDLAAAQLRVGGRLCFEEGRHASFRRVAALPGVFRCQREYLRSSGREMPWATPRAGRGRLVFIIADGMCGNR